MMISKFLSRRNPPINLDVSERKKEGKKKPKKNCKSNVHSDKEGQKFFKCTNLNLKRKLMQSLQPTWRISWRTKFLITLQISFFQVSLKLKSIYFYFFSLCCCFGFRSPLVKSWLLSVSVTRGQQTCTIISNQSLVLLRLCSLNSPTTTQSRKEHSLTLH